MIMIFFLPKTTQSSEVKIISFQLQIHSTTNIKLRNNHERVKKGKKKIKKKNFKLLAYGILVL